MSHPEMSHSPAYYQGTAQPVTASYHHDSASASAAQQPQNRPSTVPPRHADLPHPDSRAVPYHPYHSSQAPEPRRPESARPTRHSVTSVSSPHFENGSILTWGSNSSGAARKEERIRGSLTDHSSYMSDNHPVSRAHKRTMHDGDAFVEDRQDALLMLFRMSIPVPLFSFCASLYAVFGLLFVLLISPLRLCSCIPYLRDTSFRAQLCDLLVPSLHVHERLICLSPSSFRSSSTQWIYNNQDPSPADPSEGYSICGLIAVLLFSSLLSIALLLVAWTAAFFWVFAMVLGNPDGTERKDDGRAAVLGVSRWWQRWLGKARKLPR